MQTDCTIIEINPNKTSRMKMLAQLEIFLLQKRIAKIGQYEWDTEEDFEAFGYRYQV